MTTYSFICKAEGDNKFAVESEISNLEDLKAKGIFCPHCGKKWGNPDAIIEWNPGYSVKTTPSRSSVASDNREASAWAEREAAKSRAELNARDPEIAPGIRKSIVDTITERAAEII